MSRFIEFTKNYWLCLIVAAAVFGMMQWQAKGVAADPDGFYHAKNSQLLAEGRTEASFPWLQYTTWREGYANQHFLYHAALIPFNTVEKLPWSIITFGILFSLVFWKLLKRLGVKAKTFWLVLLLLGSVDFLFRINLVKANVLSLILMCFIFLLALEWQTYKRTIHLLGMALASFIFVWTYGGFVFLPVLLLTYTTSVLICKKEIDIYPGLAVAAGVVLGFLLHPHQSNLLMSLYNQLFQTGLGAHSAVPAGNEWLPYNINWFIKSDIALLFIWGLSVIVAYAQLLMRRLSWYALWFQLNTLFLLYLAVSHRRFIEYFVPFAVLAAATTFAPFLKQIGWGEIKESFQHWQLKVGVVICLAMLVFAFHFNFSETSKALSDATSVNAYKNAAMEMAEDSNQQGDLILSTQWDQFPQLWYWNSKNYYMVGLDPTFMYLEDPQKYWNWRKIADDNPADWGDPQQVYRLIKEHLNTKYIFAEKARNPDIISHMQTNPQYYQLLYEDENVVAFKVL